MKNILLSSAISITITLLIAVMAYYLMPVDPIMVIGDEDMLGATITTINASDRLTDSRSVINTNFTNLNSAKIEVSTTTLPNITTLENLVTVGTLTTGTWNADTLTVAYGGTGSTTLLSNAVLLGNGTSGIKAVPAGSEGQVLKLSSGVPTWDDADVNEAENYDWTGIHTFSTGTTTFNGQTYLNDVNIASGTLNEYPTASTSIASKGYVDNTFYGFTSSDNLQVIAPTERNTALDAYTKVKSIVVNGWGNIKVAWKMRSGTNASTVYGKVYVDDIAIGSEKTSESETYATSTESSINVYPGAKVQLYIHGQSGGPVTCYIKDFTLFWDEGRSTDDYYIITN